MNQHFQTGPNEVANRARQAGIALPGDAAPAGMRSPEDAVREEIEASNNLLAKATIAAAQALAGIVGDVPLRQLAGELYLRRKQQGHADDMLEMMRESCTEALAMQTIWDDVTSEWVAARQEAVAQIEVEKAAAYAAEVAAAGPLAAVEDPSED